MQAGFSRLEKTDIQVGGKKHKAKEFHVISGIICKDASLEAQLKRWAFGLLGVVLSQSLERDLHELGVLWGRRPCPHYHSVLWNCLNQFRY